MNKKKTSKQDENQTTNTDNKAQETQKKTVIRLVKEQLTLKNMNS